MSETAPEMHEEEMGTEPTVVETDGEEARDVDPDGDTAEDGDVEKDGSDAPAEEEQSAEE